MPVKKDTGSVIAEADGGVGGLLDQNPNIAINAAIIAGKPNITIYKTKRKTVHVACHFTKGKKILKLTTRFNHTSVLY